MMCDPRLLTSSSERMYRTRIKNWGLATKKTQAADVADLLLTQHWSPNSGSLSPSPPPASPSSMDDAIADARSPTAGHFILRSPSPGSVYSAINDAYSPRVQSYIRRRPPKLKQALARRAHFHGLRPLGRRSRIIYIEGLAPIVFPLDAHVGDDGTDAGGAARALLEGEDAAATGELSDLDLPPPALSPWLYPPHHLRLEEDVFRIVHNYARGSFDSGAWVFEPRRAFIQGADRSAAAPSWDRVLNFYALFREASAMLAGNGCHCDAGKTGRAFALLNAAFDGLAALLRDQFPFLLHNLLRAAALHIHAVGAAGLKLSRELFRHVAELAQKVGLPSSNPLTVVARRLLDLHMDMGPDRVAGYSKEAMETLTDARSHVNAALQFFVRVDHAILEDFRRQVGPASSAFIRFSLDHHFFAADLGLLEYGELRAILDDLAGNHGVPSASEPVAKLKVEPGNGTTETSQSSRGSEAAFDTMYIQLKMAKYLLISGDELDMHRVHVILSRVYRGATERCRENDSRGLDIDRASERESLTATSPTCLTPPASEGVIPGATRTEPGGAASPHKAATPPAPGPGGSSHSGSLTNTLPASSVLRPSAYAKESRAMLSGAALGGTSDQAISADCHDEKRTSQEETIDPRLPSSPPSIPASPYEGYALYCLSDLEEVLKLAGRRAEALHVRCLRRGRLEALAAKSAPELELASQSAGTVHEQERTSAVRMMALAA